MILKLINHNEEYAVREITASFFPKIKFEFSQNTSDGDYVVSEYIKDGDNCKNHVTENYYSLCAIPFVVNAKGLDAESFHT